MNNLPPDRARKVYAAFAAGLGNRVIARRCGVDRKTAVRYRRAWLAIRGDLQRAYDALWEGDAETCDAINAALPEPAVEAMLDAWLDDQFDDEKSGWHQGYEPIPDAT